MNIFSESKQGFFDKRINGKNIPSDAVEVSQEQMSEIVGAIQAGKIVSIDEDGGLHFQGKPGRGATFMAEQIRRRRTGLLIGSDWTQLQDVALSSAEKESWADYRQQLRDITDQSGFPSSVVWPEPPNA